MHLLILEVEGAMYAIDTASTNGVWRGGTEAGGGAVALRAAPDDRAQPRVGEVDAAARSRRASRLDRGRWPEAVRSTLRGMRSDPTALAIGGCALLGVAMGLLAQGIAPLYVPTHEFTQIFASAGLPILTFATAALHDRLPDSPQGPRSLRSGPVGRAWGRGGPWAGGAFAVQLAANAIAWDCRMGGRRPSSSG